MKKICANCTFWKRKVDFKGNDKFGDCANEHFVYSGDGSEATIDGMKYWDYESYSAGFETGENFGCIHFAKKDSDLTESAQGTK